MDFGFASQVGFRALTVLTFLPAIGALLMVLFVRKHENAYKTTALVTALGTLGLAIYLLTQFRTGTAEFQFVENFHWIPSLGINYHLGVDGISLLLVLLTAFLTVIAILGSWNYVKDRQLAFFVSLLLLETGMIGVFVAMDLFVFYVFWEVQLIPMFFLIGIWGGERRIYAAIKFFLYTFVGSVVMLVAIIGIVWWYASHTGVTTFDMLALRNAGFPYNVQVLAFVGFFIAFAIKVPMFPLHTWLPDAHVEAPTAGSVLLAGILLKMGVYGMIRFCIGFFPEVAVQAIPWVMILSVIAIIYGAAMSLIQTDMKKLVAYSSVSHMGFVTAGLFAFNLQGVTGSVIQMINHGILTGALFQMVGFFYERSHTRLIKDYGGVAQPMPVAAAFLSFFVLGSLGLPGLNGFVGEFLILVGIFQYAKVFAVLASVGIILGAAYLLWMYQRTMFQELKNKKWLKVKDLNAREIVTLVPLAALAVFIGVYPVPLMNLLSGPAQSIVAQVQPYLADGGNGLLRLATSIFGGGL